MNKAVVLVLAVLLGACGYSPQGRHDVVCVDGRKFENVEVYADTHDYLIYDLPYRTTIERSHCYIKRRPR